LGGIDGIATRLTWEGHEFLDKIRSDTMWNRVRERVAQESLGWSFQTIRAVADKLILAAISNLS
jgi:hypothetical protein